MKVKSDHRSKFSNLRKPVWPGRGPNVSKTTQSAQIGNKNLIQWPYLLHLPCIVDVPWLLGYYMWISFGSDSCLVRMSNRASEQVSRINHLLFVINSWAPHSWGLETLEILSSKVSVQVCGQLLETRPVSAIPKYVIFYNQFQAEMCDFA